MNWKIHTSSYWLFYPAGFAELPPAISRPLHLTLARLQRTFIKQTWASFLQTDRESVERMQWLAKRGMRALENLTFSWVGKGVQSPSNEPRARASIVSPSIPTSYCAKVSCIYISSGWALKRSTNLHRKTSPINAFKESVINNRENSVSNCLHH